MAREAVDVDEALQHLDAYRRQIELVGRNLELLHAVRAEANRARTALEGWQDQTPDSEIMVPLGANTFVHAKVGQPDTILLGVGRGYSAQRPTAEAITWLQKREKELDAEADQTSQGLFRLRQEAAQLQELIEEAYADMQQQGPPS
jgi:prefoldin alpha subunit